MVLLDDTEVLALAVHAADDVRDKSSPLEFRVGDNVGCSRGGKGTEGRKIGDIKGVAWSCCFFAAVESLCRDIEGMIWGCSSYWLLSTRHK